MFLGLFLSIQDGHAPFFSVVEFRRGLPSSSTLTGSGLTGVVPPGSWNKSDGLQSVASGASSDDLSIDLSESLSLNLSLVLSLFFSFLFSRSIVLSLVLFSFLSELLESVFSQSSLYSFAKQFDSKDLTELGSSPPVQLGNRLMEGLPRASAVPSEAKLLPIRSFVIDTFSTPWGFFIGLRFCSARTSEVPLVLPLLLNFRM